MTQSHVAEVTRQICVVEGEIAGAAKVKSLSNTDNSKLQLKIALVARVSTFLLKNLIKLQSLIFFKNVSVQMYISHVSVTTDVKWPMYNV